MATKREQLEALVPQTQAFADELDGKEAPTAEEWAKLDTMVKDVGRLAGEVKAEGERTGTMSDAKAFLAALGGAVDNEKGKDPRIVTAHGLPMDPQGKTLGELFIESGAYKEFTGRYGDDRGIIKDSIKGIQSGPFTADRKALLTGLSDTSAGAMVQPTYYGPITDLIGERELTVYDLVTKGQTNSDEIQYVRVTAKTNNAAPVAEATDATFQTYDPTTGAPILTVGGGYKPESSVALERVSTTVKTIAHWMPMTKRAVSDAGQVRTMVDTFLRYGLNEELEDQILSGGGTGENFTGILSTSGIQTVGSAGTDIDAVVDAIKAIRVTGRRRPNARQGHCRPVSRGRPACQHRPAQHPLGPPRGRVYRTGREHRARRRLPVGGPVGARGNQHLRIRPAPRLLHPQPARRSR
jgi:HK97 family phage major capsid protein